ncbi:YdcF family protein [Falsigemmobacter faecalis]|uniref:YdcF family protein n=1 Tax=Falsigemmobacter faecalis TaxID=2488730 RepID=UPI001F32AC39|nr:YdcF family protein [Falsigemmobacter faecalis]
MREEPQPVDLAFVFGSPTLSSLQPAIALYQAGLTRRILISGAGKAPGFATEWQFYQAAAMAAGVPQSALILEKKARHTRENAAFGAALIALDPGWAQVRSMAVCAKPFHMRRAVMTLRRHLPEGIRLIPQPPSDPADLAAETWWRTPQGRERVPGELGKISDYALKGDLGDF